ncbi:MAG TPA: hypothetical protein VM183_12310 [Burkholderiales bacterium]|nr:hypothetical protein [Burkholderiales bacterium]
MNKLAIPLSALALASLSACVVYEPDRPANTFTSSAIAPQPIAFQTGPGTIAKITASPSYSTSSAAGSTTAPVRAGYPFNRLMVRMDNGATQYLDTDSNDFRSGMRVELLPDRTIRPLDSTVTVIK